MSGFKERKVGKEKNIKNGHRRNYYSVHVYKWQRAQIKMPWKRQECDEGRKTAEVQPFFTRTMKKYEVFSTLKSVAIQAGQQQ